jgi:hypothetical protein
MSTRIFFLAIFVLAADFDVLVLGFVGALEAFGALDFAYHRLGVMPLAMKQTADTHLHGGIIV